MYSELACCWGDGLRRFCDRGSVQMSRCCIVCKVGGVAFRCRGFRNLCDGLFFSNCLWARCGCGCRLVVFFVAMQHVLCFGNFSSQMPCACLYDVFGTAV